MFAVAAVVKQARTSVSAHVVISANLIAVIHDNQRALPGCVERDVVTFGLQFRYVTCQHPMRSKKLGLQLEKLAGLVSPGGEAVALGRGGRCMG